MAELKNPCIGCKKYWYAERHTNCMEFCDDLKKYKEMYDRLCSEKEISVLKDRVNKIKETKPDISEIKKAREEMILEVIETISEGYKYPIEMAKQCIGCIKEFDKLIISYEESK